MESHAGVGGSGMGDVDGRRAVAGWRVFAVWDREAAVIEGAGRG